MPLFVDTLFSLSSLVDLLQLKQQRWLSLVFQEKAPAKGYDDDESTSREERIEADKLSVLPSLPENLKVTGSANLSKYVSRAPPGILQRGFCALIKIKKYHGCYYPKEMLTG